jgi:hypothetical protein
VSRVPWKVRKSGDKYCVVKKADGETVACHETQAQARAQLRALYAAEPNASVREGAAAPESTTPESTGSLDARELNLVIRAARERDVNIPGPGGHDLLKYWTRGPGAIKIRWGTDGSFDRCVRNLGKYVRNPQGLCAEYHKAATGEWPAEKGVPSSGELVELSDVVAELVASSILEPSMSTSTSTAFAATPNDDAAEANLETPDAGNLNAAARRIAAERGWALPDGSYPIRDQEHHGLADLDKAIRAVGRGSAPHDKIRRHIIKRARALEASDRIPGNWSASGKREEAAALVYPFSVEAQVSATSDTLEEFHGTHDQSSHGNPSAAELKKLGGLKNVTKADLAETIKSLGSGGKPTSSRKINPRSGSAEYERGVGQRTSNYYDEDDVDEDEADRRSVAPGNTSAPRVDSTRKIVTAAAGKKKCPSGQHKMSDGSCMSDDEMSSDGDKSKSPTTEYADEPWEGTLVVEGAESGDGRIFALGSLDWAQLPLPLLYQPANTGGHSGSFTVGEIAHAARRGNQVYGWGHVFGTALGGEHGDGIRNTMKVGGVSVDVDKVKDADVELVFNDDEAEPGAGGNPFAKPETTIFHRGRIRGATLVAFPAFVEAKLRFTGALAEISQGEGVVEAAKFEDCGCGGQRTDVDVADDVLVAHGTHNQKSHGNSVDGGGLEDLNPSIKGPSSVAGFVDSRGVRFIAHEHVYVSPDVERNVPAEQRGLPWVIQEIHDDGTVTVFRQGKNNFDETKRISQKEVMRKKDYERQPTVASVHDCGCETDETAIVVASAEDDSTHTITIPNVPSAHWFSEPTDVELSGALTITDEGRLYGLVAPANVTHRSVKTKVPRNVDFSRFHKAETIVRGGGRVVTGVITANCGHALTQNYGTLDQRREHYDNSCSVLANVRVGYTRGGDIWVAGALNPGADPAQVAQALGCSLSLDVQPHPDRPGVREFIAAHVVPVPGFPLARSRPSASYSDGVLSAAALPIEYVGQHVRPARPDAHAALEFVMLAKASLARQLGIDPLGRKRELASRLGVDPATSKRELARQLELV